MSGYTPIFRTVFDGTLHGKWPQTGVWLALLAMADKHGLVDRSPPAIASDIGIDEPTLMACIEEFCAPDPLSRTRDHEGRRLELIDPDRPWGWRILNHGKYRERARKQAWDAERTESGRDAERKRLLRAENVPTRPDASRLSPLSDADTDTDVRTLRSSSSQLKTSSLRSPSERPDDLKGQRLRAAVSSVAAAKRLKA